MSRPLLARVDTKSAESKQRREVLRRDNFLCRFEIEYRGKGNPRWLMCGRNATDTAHIVRRHLCGKARFHADVALRACRQCHDKYDRHEPGVRVPLDRMKRALAAIDANSKVPLKRV